MSTRFIGHAATPGTAKAPSSNVRLIGKFVTITGFSTKYAPALFAAVGGASNEALWDFMLGGPFPDLASLEAHIAEAATITDPCSYVILLNKGTPDSAAPDSPPAVGMCSLHRIDLPNRVCEVGKLIYGSALARTRAATEAMYLMAKHAIEDLGFRRYEWKANTLNKPSLRAAERLGFTYEGTFRQHMIIRGGHNRDSAWYSILDGEWPRIKLALRLWLDDSNFDEDGKQIQKLEEIRAQLPSS